MRTFFIVHEPGMSPRVGFPLGDETASLKEWQAHNKGAAIYVVDALDGGIRPGSINVETADGYLAMMEPPEFDDDDI